MSSKGKGYRTFRRSGFEILVGKGADDNDSLTFDVAESVDFWLHVAGHSGSHVVIRNPDRVDAPPRDVLDHAARLAAWFSRARGIKGKVEVHFCRVADVRKSRGQPAGKVQLRRWESVRVYAREPPAAAESEGDSLVDYPR